MKTKHLLFAAVAIAAAMVTAIPGAACSRVLWKDANQKVVVGRNMDWPEDMHSKLWAFPRHITRSGLGSGKFTWTSKYGSVVISSFNMGVADGMNEKGLVINALWLTEASYAHCDTGVPGLSLALGAQYFLDNFTSVEAVINEMKSGKFQIESGMIPRPNGDQPATMHIAVADASGDSAVIEIVNDGEIHYYYIENSDPAKWKNPQYPAVMTNSPPYPDQETNLHNYIGFGGRWPIPATSASDDRFVRATFLQRNLPISQVKNSLSLKDEEQSIMETVLKLQSVMRNVAQPFTTENSLVPYASLTRFRTIADPTDMRYFVDLTFHPALMWVDLKKINFALSLQRAWMDLSEDEDVMKGLMGDVTDKLKWTNDDLKFKPSQCVITPK